MARRFYMDEQDGTLAVHVLGRREEVPEGAIPVPRLPKPGERWRDGRWVLDHALLADFHADPAHVARARQHKLLEAIAVKSGVQLTAGLLAKEAKLRRVTLDAMADIVLEQAQPFMETEVARMAAKTKG
jgi:hypothetical protein